LLLHCVLKETLEAVGSSLKSKLGRVADLSGLAEIRNGLGISNWAGKVGNCIEKAQNFVPQSGLKKKVRLAKIVIEIN